MCVPLTFPCYRLRNQIPSVKQSPPTNFGSSRKPQTIIKRTIRNDGTIVPMATTTDNNTYTAVTLQTEQDDAVSHHLVKTDSNHNMDDTSQDDMQDEEILDEDDEDVDNLIELKFIDTVHQPQQHADHTQLQQQQHQQQQPQQHQMTFHQGSMQIVHHPSDGSVQFTSKYSR